MLIEAVNKIKRVSLFLQPLIKPSATVNSNLVAFGDVICIKLYFSDRSGGVLILWWSFFAKITKKAVKIDSVYASFQRFNGAWKFASVTKLTNLWRNAVCNQNNSLLCQKQIRRRQRWISKWFIQMLMSYKINPITYLSLFILR